MNSSWATSVSAGLNAARPFVVLLRLVDVRQCRMETIRELLRYLIVAGVGGRCPQFEIVLLEDAGSAEVMEALAQDIILVALRSFLFGQDPAQHFHFRAAHGLPLANDHRFLCGPNLGLDERQVGKDSADDNSQSLEQLQLIAFEELTI